MSFKTPIDEKQLLEQLHRPETASQAFDVVMREYGEAVYWQIRKMVMNHDDANDLLQNVFIKAWNNIANFRGDAKLSTWLHKIAINESINFINKEKQRPVMSESGEDSFLIERLEADKYFDGDEIQLALQKAIAELPDKQRLVFNMRYFDEMKYDEMSELLGTSVGALKASYHHAMKKIEDAMSRLEL